MPGEFGLKITQGHGSPLLILFMAKVVSFFASFGIKGDYPIQVSTISL